MKKPILIGIAGGSGSGKSTLCETLREKYPEVIGLVQLDDYYRPTDEVPKLNGMVNWDCPEALFIERLICDLSELQEGMSVVVNTKNDRLNPEFKNTGKRIPVIFQPKSIILVEGFLVLAIKSIQKKLFTSIWLDAPQNTRLERRIHSQSDEYKKTVLASMHKKYVEPSKKYAVCIIDASTSTATQVFQEVERFLFEFAKQPFNNQTRSGYE